MYQSLFGDFYFDKASYIANIKSKLFISMKTQQDWYVLDICRKQLCNEKNYNTVNMYYEIYLMKKKTKKVLKTAIECYC